jgi:hypothetical protein
MWEPFKSCMHCKMGGTYAYSDFQMKTYKLFLFLNLF